MTDETESIQKLLSDVKRIIDLDDKVQEERKKRGELFNVFNVIGLWSEEVRLHSAFLAELLNAKGSHGLRDAFLKEFIDVAGISDLNFDTANSTISTEYYIGKKENETGGRIDILIRSGDKAIIIENKIYAYDQENQILRYSNYGKENAKGGYRLLYLTLDGKDADDISTNGNKGLSYFRLSYQKEIVEWLNRCIEKAACQPLVRETIRQYIELIKQLTNNTMEEENNEKLFSLLARNAETSLKIIDLEWQFKTYIINKYLKQEVIDIAKDLNMESEFLDGKEFGYCFYRKNWDLGIWIYSYKDQFRIGISPYKNNWWDERDKYKKVFENKKMLCFENEPDGEDWPYGYSILNKYEKLDTTAFTKIIDGKYKDFIEKKIKEVVDEINDNHIPMSFENEK